MASSLYPAFVKIEYHSAYAPHVMILPTREYTPPGPGFDDGSILNWEDDPVDAFAMVNDLCTLMAELFPATHNFDTATFYTLATPTSDPNPQHSVVIDTPGTSASTAWRKAVQQTWTFRTTEFGIAKLTFLDIPTDNNFDRVATLEVGSDQAAVAAEFTSVTEGWSGRDNARPATFLQASATLNEKLRREYRMN